MRHIIFPSFAINIKKEKPRKPCDDSVTRLKYLSNLRNSMLRIVMNYYIIDAIGR